MTRKKLFSVLMIMLLMGQFFVPATQTGANSSDDPGRLDVQVSASDNQSVTWEVKVNQSGSSLDEVSTQLQFGAGLGHGSTAVKSGSADVQQTGDGYKINMEPDAGAATVSVTAFINDPHQINFQLKGTSTFSDGTYSASDSARVIPDTTVDAVVSMSWNEVPADVSYPQVTLSIINTSTGENVQSVTFSNGESSHVFTALPEYNSDAQKIQYSVKTNELEHFDTVINDFTVIHTYIPPPPPPEPEEDTAEEQEESPANDEGIDKDEASEENESQEGNDESEGSDAENKDEAAEEEKEGDVNEEAAEENDESNEDSNEESGDEAKNEAGDEAAEEAIDDDVNEEEKDESFDDGNHEKLPAGEQADEALTEEVAEENLSEDLEEVTDVQEEKPLDAEEREFMEAFIYGWMTELTKEELEAYMGALEEDLYEDKDAQIIAAWLNGLSDEEIAALYASLTEEPAASDKEPVLEKEETVNGEEDAALLADFTEDLCPAGITSVENGNFYRGDNIGYKGQFIDVWGTWAVPEGAKAGDTFTLMLPDEVKRFVMTTHLFRDSDGEPAGQIEVFEQTAIFTLAVDGPAEGTFKIRLLEANTNEMLTSGDYPLTYEHWFGNGLCTDTTTTTATVNYDLEVNENFLQKYAYEVGEDFVDWAIVVNAEEDPALAEFSNITFKDDFKGFSDGPGTFPQSVDFYDRDDKESNIRVYRIEVMDGKFDVNDGELLGDGEEGASVKIQDTGNNAGFDISFGSNVKLDSTYLIMVKTRKLDGFDEFQNCVRTTGSNFQSRYFSCASTKGSGVEEEFDYYSNLYLEKFDEDGMHMDGVEFTLYEADKETVADGPALTENGLLNFSDIGTGLYYLKETATVEGYLLNGKYYTVIVGDEDDADEDGNVPVWVEWQQVTEEAPFQITNYRGAMIDKKINGSETELDIGRGVDFTYDITVDLPVDIKDYTSFKVTDELDSYLELQGDPVVMVDGEVFTGIDWDFEDQLLTVDVTDFAGLDGKSEMLITLTVQITDDAPGDVGIDNMATLDFTTGTGTSGTIDSDVVTVTPPILGSVTITKVDEETRAVLAGAEFELTTADGELIDEGSTDEDGLLIFEDLELGDYKLYEKKAPAGYRLLMVPIEFSVTSDLYDVELTVENSKIDWEIPPVGGMGTLGFYLAGLLIMSTALGMMFRRRKKDSPADS